MTRHEPTDLTRRGAVAALGAAVVAAPATAQERNAVSDRQATGVVFEDRSATGVRQSGDPGLPDILVSNGRDVVRTDAEGRYTLPLEDDTVVFVIKPSGYALPSDDNNLPRFSYIHQPTGTPAALAMRFPGIAPTGAVPTSIDFGLRRAEEPSAFDVVLITDPQPQSPAELEFVRDVILTGLVGTRAAFGMTTGDIMFDDLSLYPRYNRMIGRIGLPWFHIGGNHDINFEAGDARYSRETFKRVYGAPYYAFNYGGALFLMLDNVRYLGAGLKVLGGGRRYEGRIGERQLAFVEGVLRETPSDRLVVVAMHIPLHNDLDDAASTNTADAAQLLRLLGDRPAFSVSGHTHTTEHHYLGPDGRPGADGHHHHVMTAASGSWWSGPFDRRGIAAADSRDGNPNGYHVLSIDGARYTTRYVPANEPGERQMRISLENQLHRNGEALSVAQLLGSPISSDAASTTLVVNVFDGGPRTKVLARIGRRAPVALTRVRRSDPFVEQVFARNASTKKAWVKAEPSSHIWTGPLPADLEAGTHRVDIEVADEYGRTRSDHLVVEVTSAA